uniref:Uncharacterized protein n=1 Tax=Sus scrofa TaxID=9823 RepID=A0A480F2L0_PIG
MHISEMKWYIKKIFREFPLWFSRLITQHSAHEVTGSIPELRIQHCHKLQHRPQMRLGSSVFVAWACSWSSDLISSLATSMCHRCGHKKKKSFFST